MWIGAEKRAQKNGLRFSASGSLLIVRCAFDHVDAAFSCLAEPDSACEWQRSLLEPQAGERALERQVGRRKF